MKENFYIKKKNSDINLKIDIQSRNGIIKLTTGKINK